MTKEHIERISHLLEMMESAEIYAGAEFEALCNDGNYLESEIFYMIRDVLKAQRAVINDYFSIKQGDTHDN